MSLETEVISSNPAANEFLFRQQPGIWSEVGFNLNRVLDNIKDPMLEIAGPTPKGYQTIAHSVLNRSITLNIHQVGSRVLHRPQVDVISDAHHLPFVDECMGAVFFSAFPDSIYPSFQSGVVRKYREPMLEEAERVLKTNGVLVMQYGSIGDIRRATEFGMQMKYMKVNKLKGPGLRGLGVPSPREDVLFMHTRSLFVLQKLGSE